MAHVVSRSAKTGQPVGDLYDTAILHSATRFEISLDVRVILDTKLTVSSLDTKIK